MSTGYCYMYNAALWCEECGDKLRAELPCPKGADVDDESTWDSDEWPKAPERTKSRAQRLAEAHAWVLVPKAQGYTLARLKRAGYRLIGWKRGCAIVHFTR